MQPDTPSPAAEGRGGKLTEPQALLLREISRRPKSGGATYRPLVRLLALGLVEAKAGRWSDTFHITDAGREALSREKAE